MGDHEINDRLTVLLGELTKMQDDSADQEVPGWIFSKPTLTEINSDLALMSARSKPGEHNPFILPDDAEVAIAVLEGSIRMDAGAISTTMVGKHFTIATAGPGRSITALEPFSRITCIYFRTGAVNNGQLAVTAR